MIKYGLKKLGTENDPDGPVMAAMRNVHTDEQALMTWDSAEDAAQYAFDNELDGFVAVEIDLQQ